MSKTRKTWLWSITEYGYGISPLKMLRAWAFAALTLLLIGGFLVGGFAMSRASCVNRATIMQMDYEWRVLGGCLVEFDGAWMPMDRFWGLEELRR